MRLEPCQEICNHTHRNMCFLSGRHRTVDIQPLRSWGNARRSDLADVCTTGHAQARSRQKWKSKAAKQKPLVTLSLQNPGCSLLRPSPAPSFCPFVISNAHLLPLIKGIIIYNFLLKNQLCILSIADRNSQLVTWLEKIDRTVVCGRKKKAALKLFTDVKSHAAELSQIMKISNNVVK